MSLNRVIGRGGQIPWHLPADFGWFKRTTLGHAVLMGRRTYESLGKPLPGRRNLVLTRGPAIPGVEVIRDAATFDEAAFPEGVFLIGGAEIYIVLLPRCTDLFLTVVQREVEGDAFFPAFEEAFALADIPLVTPDFEVRHYRRITTPPAAVARADR